MAKPECSVPKELARMEQNKRSEYGLGQANPNTLFDRVVPAILSNTVAQVHVNHVSAPPSAPQGGQTRARAHLTHGVAWMIASHELYAPISCILLAMHYQMFQECCPIVQTPDNPRELAATGASQIISQPCSQGEPWPDADLWHGQDSQLSTVSTQGVDRTISECMRPSG